MTKKNYVSIADAIYDARLEVFDHGMVRALDPLIMRIAANLKADNPAFEEGRFIEACKTGNSRRLLTRRPRYSR